MAFVSVGKKIMIRSLQRRNERGFFRKRGGSFSLVLIISRLVYFSPTTSLFVSSASETPRVIGLWNRKVEQDGLKFVYVNLYM